MTRHPYSGYAALACLLGMALVVVCSAVAR